MLDRLPMASPIPWRRAVGSFSRDARLYLVTAALNGFTIFGGIYSLLLNLYLLRLGYGPVFIGAVNGVALLGWALACLPAGLLGRIWGGRISMAVGMAGTMAGSLLLPLCEITPAGAARAAWLIAANLLANVSISLYDVNSQPFLAKSSTKAERDHLFSVQAALWPLAGFAGSLAGGVLPGLFAGVLGTTTDSPAPYRYPLLIAAGTLAFSTGALAATSKDRRVRDKARPGAACPRPTLSGAASPRRPGRPTVSRSAPRLPLLLIPLLGVVMVFQGAGEGASRTFFNVYMDAALGSPTARIGLLAAIAQLAAVPAALLMPAAARRWGHNRVFLWGTVGIAAGILPLALVPQWAAAGAGYTVVIAFVSLTRAAVTVYLMEIMPEGKRAAMSGVYTMAIGLSWSAVAAGGSRVITGLGYPAFFLGGAAATLLSAAAFALTTRRVPAPPHRPVQGMPG